MSRRIAKRRAAAAGEEGFSLIEVLVAITLFGLLSSAVVPLLITAARASSITKYDTGARNLGQERLERMRTAPFHTPQSALAGPDLLDTYFPSLTPAANVDAAGYVTPTAARSEGEPSGAFYRYIVAPAEIAPDTSTAETFSRYKQRVATQFLSSTGQPFAPASWNSLDPASDDAVPSFIVRATVTTRWEVGALSKSYSFSSNLTEGRADEPLAVGELRATALRVTSRVPDPATGELADLLMEGGILTADGQVGRGAKVSSSSLGAFSSLVPGERRDGANAGATSPTNATSPARTSSPMSLSLDGNELTHFGTTSVLASPTSADNGQMLAGTSTSPIGASVQTNSSIRFTNQPLDPSGRLLLNPATPVVRSTTSSEPAAGVTGFMSSTGGSSHRVAQTATAMTPTLSVLPTSYAPDGLLQVKLESSTLTCGAGIGVTPTTLAYRATVRYWRYDSATGTEGYATAPLVLTEASASDALAALLGTTPGTALLAHRNADGTTLSYADYFTGLTSATSSSLAAERVMGTGKVESRHGLVTLNTVSLRSDIDSPVSLQLGVLSCLAKDVR